MLTRADELKADIAKLDAALVEAEVTLQQRKKSLALVEAHIDSLYVQRMRLDGWLQREQATVRKQQGKCVTLESNGVEWRV